MHCAYALTCSAEKCVVVEMANPSRGILGTADRTKEGNDKRRVVQHVLHGDPMCSKMILALGVTEGHKAHTTTCYTIDKAHNAETTCVNYYSLYKAHQALQGWQFRKILCSLLCVTLPVPHNLHFLILVISKPQEL